MGAVKVLPYYTVAEWEWWDGKWELIEGIPFAMSPAPLPKHQRIAGNLFQEFNLQLKKCRHCKVYLAIDWQIKEDTILEPDLLVVCGDIKRRLNFAPELTVEILSKATALKDRNNKFHIYEEQKVKYYLIIDPDKNIVEIYLHKGSKYELLPATDTYTFSFSQDCAASIDFTAIWE